MSAGEDSTLCQGILKKRKDKIRLKWVTYWFKLHNATLFFYNIKHGNISDLRGQYYLIEIESVRELMWTKKKHYVFEIAMKNGKRKVLAAETAYLRQHWMSQLVQAMKHRVCNPAEPNTNGEMALDHMCRAQSSTCSVYSSSQSDASDVHKNSNLWSPSMHSAAALPPRTSHIYIDIEMSPPVESSQCTEDEGKHTAEVIHLENDYDVLPLCKPLPPEEDIYDTPPSNRRVSEQEHASTESIYDVPKSAFWKQSVNKTSCAEELPEITGLLHDMVACLGGNSADWARATAPGANCQP